MIIIIVIYNTIIVGIFTLQFLGEYIHTISLRHDDSRTDHTYFSL